MTSAGHHHANVWDPLFRELDAWAARSATAYLWLRDDDATKPTPALETLAQLTSNAGVPAVLAVIPALVEPELGGYVRSKPLLDAAVHGYTHANHAPAGQKSEEFPIARGETVTREELSRGLDRLRQLLGPRALSLYVPPWNRISPTIAQLLPAAGYTGLSTFGKCRVLENASALIELNTHVDIIDWRGTRGGRDMAWLVGDLVSALRDIAPATASIDGSRTESSSSPIADATSIGAHEGEPLIGILTHHLVHDTAAWRFLEALFAATGAHPAVAWRRIGELVPPAEQNIA